MRRAHRTSIGLAGIVLLIVLVAVPSALAASAVDQYSEGIPTAGGQKSTHDLGNGGGGPATIPPRTQGALQGTKRGAAVEKAAKLTAPKRSDLSGGSQSGSDGSGL